jgi:hypothetical protein
MAKSTYSKELKQIGLHYKNFIKEANLDLRIATAKALLESSPVDTGFLRNNIQSNTINSFSEIKAADKAALLSSIPFQNLSYGESASMEEIKNVLRGRNKKDLSPEMYLCAVVEYAQWLADKPKYMEFHRKASDKAQRDIDVTLMAKWRAA